MIKLARKLPLGMFLDEAFLICPVPLESWTADMGGRGVTIYAAFQGRSQVLSRWGDRDGATILNNAASVMVFGGTKDRDDLIFWSTLAGDRDEPITTTDLHGRVASRTTRKVPVVPPAQIANLPEGRVLLIRRGIAPALGRAQMVWRRWDRVGCSIRWAAFARRRPRLAAWLAVRGKRLAVRTERLAGCGRRLIDRATALAGRFGRWTACWRWVQAWFTRPTDDMDRDAEPVTEPIPAIEPADGAPTGSAPAAGDPVDIAAGRSS